MQQQDASLGRHVHQVCLRFQLQQLLEAEGVVGIVDGTLVAGRYDVYRGKVAVFGRRPVEACHTGELGAQRGTVSFDDAVALVRRFLDFDGVDVHGVLRVEAFHLQPVRDVLTAYDGNGPHGIVHDDVRVHARLLNVEETVVRPGVQVARFVHEAVAREELLDDAGQPDFLVQSVQQAAAGLQRDKAQAHLYAEHGAVRHVQCAGKYLTGQCVEQHCRQNSDDKFCFHVDNG